MLFRAIPSQLDSKSLRFMASRAIKGGDWIGLKIQGDNLYYHTFRTKDSTSQYEIDFLLSRNGKVVPVEVKSAKSDLHKSIDKFQEKYSSRTTDNYLIHPRDLRKDGNLKCLPFYMVVSL